MSARSLETDYLVVGCGAMGLAFVDALIADSGASVVMVDRHARPGGHWNDAYPFVRLHQPAAYYGVGSLPLGSDGKDTVGSNRGMYSLVSGAELCAYFERVMQQQLLPSGRVQVFPMCEYVGNDTFVSLLSGDEHAVRVRKHRVDATYSDTRVPSTERPSFAVAPEVRCVAVNQLASLGEPPASGYAIVGAGKTGIDACLWLLEQGVQPARIRWIKSREPWLIDRANTQPGDLLPAFVESVALQMEASAQAQTVEALFERLESTGQLLRVDPRVKATSFRCATVSRAELDQLRRIEDVVRLGRVRRIEADAVVLDAGTVPADSGWLYVDCSAPGIRKREPRPVFGSDVITLQAVRTCQPAFSAALIGYLEATCEDLEQKNALCTAVPYPDSDLDWLRMTLENATNQFRRSKYRPLQEWTERSRLNALRGLKEVVARDPEVGHAMQRYRDALVPALLNLQRLLSS